MKRFTNLLVQIIGDGVGKRLVLFLRQGILKITELKCRFQKQLLNCWVQQIPLIWYSILMIQTTASEMIFRRIITQILHTRLHFKQQK